MERLDNLLPNVEKQIESIIRGGPIGGQIQQNQADNQFLLDDVRDLFNHLTSAVLAQEASCIEDKTARINAAVRLHNKVRNLAPTVHAELRAITKACAAWLLMLFNQPVPKSLCAVIKLLSRASQETQPFAEGIALKCCTAATSLWKRVSLQTLSQIMPSLELQDIKIAVFQAYLDKATIHGRTNAAQNCSDIRAAISGAFDIVQSLPEGLKIHFAEQAVALGSRLSSIGVMEEAVYLLQIAISSIDLLGHTSTSISASGSGDVDSLLLLEKDELHNLKIKAQLSLSFAYKEMNQCDKAMASVLAVEGALIAQTGQKGGSSARLHQNMLQTVAYAKFTVLAKDGDWDLAELSLKVLIVNAPYELAIDVIRIFLEGHQGDTRSKGVELYRVMANNFPMEPEFTNTRICLVEYILSTAQLHDNAAYTNNILRSEIQSAAVAGFVESSSHKRVAELCGEIVGDHLTRKRRLNRSQAGINTGDFIAGSSYERFRRILSERVRWNRASGTWESVILWVDLLLKLLSDGTNENEEITDVRLPATQDDDKIIAQLQKVDALLHIGQNTEALVLAQAVVEEVRVTRTIVMTFLATLHVDGPNDAVRTLLRLQEGQITDINSGSGYLSMIMICAEVAKDAKTVPWSDREESVIKLLRCWLTQYSLHHAWRLETTDDDTGDEFNFGSCTSLSMSTSFLAVACEMASRYLKQNLSKIKWATAASALTVPAYFTENVEVSSAMNYSSLVAESLKEVPSTNKKRPLNKKLDLDLEIDDESDSYYSSVTKNGRDDGVEEQTKKSKGAHEHTEVVKVPCLISADHLRVHEYFFPNVADRIVEIDDIDDVLPSPPSSTEISHSGHPHQVNNNFLSTALSAQLKASSNSLKHSLKIEAESEVSTDGNDGKHSTVVGFQPTTVDSSETISLAINTISTVHVGSTFEPDEILHNSPTESTSPATLVLDNNVMGGDGSTGYHLDNLDAVNKEIRDKNSGIKCPDVVTPLRAQTLPSCVNQPSSTDQKSYTALCDYPLGIVRTKQIEQNMPSTYAYYFKTSILDVKSVILGLVKDVLALHHLLLHEGTDSSILGSFANLEWLGDLSWNIGCIMVSEHYCEVFNAFEGIPVTNSPQIIAVSENATKSENKREIGPREGSEMNFGEIREMRLVGAEFLEASANLYALVPFAEKLIGLKNQGMCLVLACSARLDASTFEDMIASQEIPKYEKENNGGLKLAQSLIQSDTLDDEDSNIREEFQISGQYKSSSVFFKKAPSSDSHILLGAEWMEQNLLSARTAAASANSLLASHAGFDDDDDDTRSFLKKVALVLEFSTLCKLKADNIMHFVESKESEFLSLSAPQLKTCADIACNERGGTVDIARKMLNYSLQICQRDSTPDYELMGMLFRKLIELSPSRRDALDRVRHFEQLASGQAHSGNISDDDEDAELNGSRKGTCPFDSTDVDYVASISFNYGLSLMDISQIDLAEIFVSKALSLLPYASAVLQGWKERMQDTYVAVLKAKEEYHKKEKNYKLDTDSISLTTDPIMK